MTVTFSAGMDAAFRPAILIVLAHPDDESFGMGGTIAHYVAMGAAVHLICATGGEEGDVDPKFLEGYASIPERRQAELDAAAKVLGLTSVTMLGYRDSGMAGRESNRHPQALAAQSVDTVAARVTHLIRELRPHVVITFDPIGGYRHPDHIAIHRATVEAFHAASDPARYPSDLPPHTPQRLFFHTFSRRFLRMAVSTMRLMGRDPRKGGRNGDVDFASLAEVEYPIHTRINIAEVFDLRRAAGECHASQGGGSMMTRGLIGMIFRLLGSEESFMLAYPDPAPGYTSRDLLDGVAW